MNKECRKGECKDRGYDKTKDDCLECLKKYDDQLTVMRLQLQQRIKRNNP